MTDIFPRFYAAVNVEWPQFGLTAEEAHAQEVRWRRALGDFEQDTLVYAMDEAVKRFKKRPRPADLVELCVAHARNKHGIRPTLTPDWATCPCGCGGLKWYLVLRDPQSGTVRTYPDTIEQLTASLPAGAPRSGPVADALLTLVGSPLTRLKQACRRGGDPLPPLAQRIGEEHGIPVYDCPRPTPSSTHLTPEF